MKYIITGYSKLDCSRVALGFPTDRQEAERRLKKLKENQAHQQRRAYTQIRIEPYYGRQLTLQFKPNT